MTMAPLIGIVADQRAVTAGSWVDVVNDTLPHTYAAAVTAAGGLPLLIPSSDTHLRHVGRLLDTLDGLFLPGGRDIDADVYGDPAHPSNDLPLRVRDELEIALTRGAHHRGMPILGACRGMQVINVAFGGTIEQHLGDRLDMAPHRDRIGTFTTHPVTASPGSHLAALTGTATFDIASHHHQGVGELGTGLVVAAVAPDGVVEAVETCDDLFVVGVQWHPEQQGSTPQTASLMRAFVAAALAYGAGRPGPVASA